MKERVENINKKILKQCREQIGLELPIVAKKIPKIADIEQGEQKPTFGQLNTISELYKVPRWVFVADTLPQKYQFNTAVPAFRQFASSNPDIFSEPKVRGLVTKLERYRELIIDLRDDMGEPIELFEPPVLRNDSSPEVVANQVREWLNVSGNLDFINWKEELEKKGVFVFLTSKYKGWSHIESEVFRGLALYYTKLPIIIINDSDAKKAQSFTLFHELGHLLRKENAIDDWRPNQNIEKWCDRLAGNVLMPTEQLKNAFPDRITLDLIKDIAKRFHISAWACLVKVSQLKMIESNVYQKYEAQLKEEYQQYQKKLKASKGGPARNRPKEILQQYGNIYTKAVFQAYYNKDIGLHKLTRLFDLKKASYVFELENQF